jgi:hypothetical protein
MRDLQSELTVAVAKLDILIPYDSAADYLFLDALGASRPEALSHFTSHGRFDLSLSEIFHMDFVKAELHYGGATSIRSDVIPRVLPVDKADGVPFPMAVSESEQESRRILGILKQDVSGFDFVSAGLRILSQAGIP